MIPACESLRLKYPQIVDILDFNSSAQSIAQCLHKEYSLNLLYGRPILGTFSSSVVHPSAACKLGKRKFSLKPIFSERHPILLRLLSYYTYLRVDTSRIT